MKKVLYTLNVNNYEPEITAITFPFLKKYADKIGAEFHIITERKYPDWPVTYEKLQIYELSKDNDWSIYIDADALVHPDLFDLTEHVKPDTVMHRYPDMAGNRWKYDDYFRRDGRHIGSGNWLTVASRWCRDLWHPVEDLTPQEAISNIYPTQAELNAGITPDHLIDDYVLSRNIARFGLKYKPFDTILEELNQKGFLYFEHPFLAPPSLKLEIIKNRVKEWGLNHGK